MAENIQRTLTVPPTVAMVSVLGANDEFLRTVEQVAPTVDLHARGNEITATGPESDVTIVLRLFDELITVVASGQALTPEIVQRSLAMLRQDGDERPAQVLTQNILSNRGRTIRPKTLNQKRYVDAIDSHTIVFGIGPAGTGKTYLAMAKAVQALQNKQVTRIILTRPAVEAGERLGFLPGTLSEKIDPYLRPLYDALHDMIDPESIPRLIAAGTIEVAPLAYMRGRTLNDAFIILDEAQNTSPEQMKMFLTRLGFGSQMVVTGDVTQIDLPGGTTSGLRIVREILDDIDDVDVPGAHRADVVRHQLVGKIVDAYGRWDAVQQTGQAARRPRSSDPAAPTQGSTMTRCCGRVMSIEVANESGVEVDETRVVDLSRFVLDHLRIHPLAELSLLLVDARRWSSCTCSGWTSRGRPTCWPSRWTSCARARTTSPWSRGSWVTSCSARRRRDSRP